MILAAAYTTMEKQVNILSCIEKLNKPIKLLGIYISNNTNETVMEIFNSKVEALLSQLH